LNVVYGLFGNTSELKNNSTPPALHTIFSQTRSVPPTPAPEKKWLRSTFFLSTSSGAQKLLYRTSSWSCGITHYAISYTVYSCTCSLRREKKEIHSRCCVSDCIGLTSGDRGGAPPPHLSMCCHRLSRPRWPSEHAATRRGRADRRGASLLPAGVTFAVPIAPAGRSFAGRRGASPPPTGSKRRPLRAKWKILRHNYNNNHPVIVVLRFNHEL
jgi:hypothetical protein